ncbi:unnamed protein product [Heterosigma akashiwo]|mmetsp:Transcript_28908/g.45585  ORF Transcript_28908/g.45585 Transcript_28908/m.45585 type:complete len:111 (+) Transcript_28908:40-372(+)|eukprot:CAMPEP_0194569674 /NCGR_PEP_ID=MMETSP0292-20121207/7292_1 /TAXON_ID=39354 /ORGANISM="Heterosigma akashiwo, Strain CCMP2393" /LENGTH=110 /DNA_ID=CAMNT_0039419965 /DNA_START=20 /DNA_END=352 /DNA_ORIENTATION=-
MMQPLGGGIQRTTIQLYRDCMRLVQHIAGKSKKGDNIRRIVGGEFRKNKDEKDEAKIEALKANAVRALSNYLVLESGMKDAQLKTRMDSAIQKSQDKRVNDISSSSTKKS